MVFEKAHDTHSLLKVKLRYYRQVYNGVGDVYLEADDGSKAWS